MKLKQLNFFILSIATACSVQASEASPEMRSLEEFETMTEHLRIFSQAMESGEFFRPFQIQQYDTDAKEVNPFEALESYKAAVQDPYYGNQVFILIDKSVGSKVSKARNGEIRTPQTMYVYVREGDELKLAKVYPVSTGYEAKPTENDTREGFLRVQSAQAMYMSRKFGASMPFSLWFESEYGTAIHETPQDRCDTAIGLRASAGCVRVCPGQAQEIFRLVTDKKYPRTSAIVLLDKRTGLPIAKGREKPISKAIDSNGHYLQAPKVIRGYPAFVRIIDGNTPEKIEEIENLIRHPTESFRLYFRPFSPQVLEMLTI